MQGIVLKATALPPPHPKSAGWNERQPRSGRIPQRSISAFSGKRVSNHRSHQYTASIPADGKCIEDAFWKKKPLQGRQITPAGVLGAYGNDRTSLRGAFFLQKLCLQNILINNRKVTPDQVIEEFSRAPDQNNKYQLAIARFQAECCLRGLPLKGQQVTPDSIVKGYQAVKATLELARFKAACCLGGLPVNGLQVTPDMVVRGFPESPEGRLGRARFKEECCLRGLPLNGRKVTPDTVVKSFLGCPKVNLALARFKAECCLRGLELNGQQVTPEAVVKDYQAASATLELARFKAECCLRSLPLNGDQVTTDAVAEDYQKAGATLELARFKVECCLRGLLLNGQQVTPDMVVKYCRAVGATMTIARFKEQCCVKDLLLNGKQVTPDEVLKDFPDSLEGRLGAARFQAECCMRGLPLNGQQVTPDAVVKKFPDSSLGKLGIARFKEHCCLNGLLFNGRQVAADEVVKEFPGSPEGRLGLARFKAECCLRGLLLNGQQIATDAVVRGFPDSQEGKLGVARFKDQCCLKGLPLNGRQVSPDWVVKDYQAARATLELARFQEQCCLRGLALHGQQITTDAVVKGFPDSPEGKLGMARFKERCCLRGLPINGQLVTPEEVVEVFQAIKALLELARFTADCLLRGLPINGQQVTPDGVVKGYQAARANLELGRFRGECCLRGLLLNGQKVTPEAVVKDYDCGGWLLEKAIFYAQLAMNARVLNNAYLDNHKVLEAYDEVPGDQSLRQAEYLMQRLNQPQWYDETSEAQDILQQAWLMLNSVPVKDEQHRLQCILKFMAMQHELTIDHQRVSAEQVLQSIKTLRRSFQNSRIYFFFLAHCHITGLPVDGQEIHARQVMECLQRFPEGSKLRQALGWWFEQCSCEANIVMDELLLKRKISDTPVYNAGQWRGDHLPDVIPDAGIAGRSVIKSVGLLVDSPGQEGLFPYQVRQYRDEPESTAVTRAETLRQCSKTGRMDFPDHQFSRLNALALKTLEIIQEINGSYSNPPLLITGSYARFLQNLCSPFNDIDIICTIEASASTLFEKLQALNSDTDSEIPKSIIIRPIPGCPEIKLPKAYNIHLKEGDLGRKAMALQVSVDTRVAYGNAAQLAVPVPGVERPVWCLSFAEETRLLNDTVEYLTDKLDLLTEQLQKGVVFDLPRTILFNTPKNTRERIYGLLMRSLLTLNKARQFIALHSQAPPGKTDWTNQLQKEKQRLHAATENLQIKLAGQVCRHDFEYRVNRWLLTTQPVNSYQAKRKQFIKALLAMMHSE
ncbi:hypothetical protein [Endozoicomonas sp. SESOKO1]|uniref:hypothetical protein n=1 Tax=Endozoicomonas sp. SESOKO1 TaxID=2828742 RepID=UPI0021485E68|nr:hypothetical protein [Endozoicomonas sp. SESOKO1]